MKNKHNWYCYACGKKLSNKYFLSSMRKSTDRVFLSCEKCAVQLDDVISVLIKEENNR